MQLIADASWTRPYQTTPNDAKAEMMRRGYGDWEFVSVDYYNAEARYTSAGNEAIQVHYMKVFWKVTMRKWVDE